MAKKSMARRVMGELRSSLCLCRATKYLDSDITLHSKSKKAHMSAGGSFSMFSLLLLFGEHGRELDVECDGLDADHAREVIGSFMNGETSELTPEDRELLKSRGRYHRGMLADLPPMASARWLDWLREDESRVLPWQGQPLPKEHEHPYPYTQAKGLTIGELVRELRSLPKDERAMVKKWHVKKQDEYLCAPEQVRREMLVAHDTAKKAA